ncbi:MAG: hypothetical protein L6416_12140 [Candidatus Omnitrophica bacterium]|nr:hypothetical protein [Candidatus Omnitrophota bacterium]
MELFKKCNVFFLAGISFLLAAYGCGYVFAQGYEEYYRHGQQLLEQGKYPEAQLAFEKGRELLGKSKEVSQNAFLETRDSGEQQKEEGKGAVVEKKQEVSRQKNTSLAAENKSLLKINRKLQKENKKLSAKLESAEKQRKRKKELPSDLQKKVKQMEAMIVERNKQLQDVQARMEQVNNDKNNLSNELALIKEELVEVYQRKSDEIKQGTVEKKMSKLLGLFGGKDEQPHGNYMTIREKLQEYESLKEGRKELLARLEGMQQKAAVQEKTLSGLAGDLESVKNNLKFKNQELIRCGQDIVLLEKINETIEKQKAAMAASTGVHESEALAALKEEQLKKLEDIKSKKEGLESEVAKLKQKSGKISELDNKVKQLEGVVQEKEAANKAVEKQLEESQKMLQSKVNESQSALEEKKKEIKALKSTQAEEQKQQALEKARLEKALEDIKSKKEGLESEVAKLKQESGKISELDNKVKQLEGVVQEKEAANKAVEKKLEEAAAGKRALEQELGGLKEKAGLLEQEKGQDVTRLENLQKQYAALEESQKMLQNNLKETMSIKTLLEEDLAKLKVNLATVQTERNKAVAAQKIKARSKDSGKEETQLLAKLNDTEASLEAKQKEFQDIWNERAILAAELSRSKLNAEAIKREKEQLIQEAAVLKQKAEDTATARAQISGIDGKLKILESTLTEKEQQLREMKNQFEATNKERESLRNELTAVKQKLVSLQQETTTQAGANNNTIKQFETIQAQNTMLQNKLRKFIEAIKSRNSQIEALQEKLKAINDAYAQSEQEKVVMAEEIVSLRGEKSRLEEGLKAK